MLKSMTGFGTGRATVAGEEITVEVKSVNHKFCEVKVRLPRELASLEANVARQVKDRVTRGAVEVFVRRFDPLAGVAVPKVNAALAVEYRRAFAEVAQSLGLPDEVSLRDIMTLEGVMRLEQKGIDLESATSALESAVSEALTRLVQMREVEGKALDEDIRSRLAIVRTKVDEIRSLAPRAVSEYQSRLSERIAELAKGISLEPQRMAQEVAIFAERTDVAEEMSRLGSHFEQFDALLGEGAPVGRRMDFLVQEFHREVNTTGSKSHFAEISARVMDAKAELERIREQVQNVE